MEYIIVHCVKALKALKVHVFRKKLMYFIMKLFSLDLMLIEGFKLYNTFQKSYPMCFCVNINKNDDYSFVLSPFIIYF